MILYTIIDRSVIGVLRVLHDAMELQRHLGEGMVFAPDDDED